MLRCSPSKWPCVSRNQAEHKFASDKRSITKKGLAKREPSTKDKAVINICFAYLLFCHDEYNALDLEREHTGAWNLFLQPLGCPVHLQSQI